MSDPWYYKQGPQLEGPVSEEHLIGLARIGRLGPNAEVRVGEHGKWYPASRVKGLFQNLAEPDLVAAEAVDSPPDEVPEADTPPTAASPTAASPTAEPPAQSSGSMPPGNKQPASTVAAKPPPQRRNSVPGRPGSVPRPQPNSAPRPRAKAVVPVAETASDSAARLSEAVKARRRKSQKTGIIVAILCLIVAAPIGGVIAYLKVTENDSATNVPQADDDPLTSASLINGIDGAIAGPFTVRRWLNSERSYGGVRDRVEFRILGVRVEPPLDAGDAKVDQDRRVMVTVGIRNVSDQDLEYVSWNAAEGFASATLTDALDGRHEVIAIDDAPLDGRLVGAELAPQDRVTDVLVFATSRGFDRLRLKLPLAAVGSRGGIGFEILREQLLASTPEREQLIEPAQGPAAGLKTEPPSTPNTSTTPDATNDGTTVRGTAGGETPSTSAPGKTPASSPPVDDGGSQPKSFDELKKSIEGSNNKTPPPADLPAGSKGGRKGDGKKGSGKKGGGSNGGGE